MSNNHSIRPYNFRAPAHADAQQVLDLMIRRDIRDYGEPDSDLEDLIAEWGRIDLDRDAWLAYTPQGELVGYAAVIPWGPNLRFGLCVDPSEKDEVLMTTLLGRCEERATLLAGEGADHGDIKAVIHISHANQQESALVRRSGFQPVKYVFNMEADLETAFPPAQWPEGITLRTMQPEKDDRAVYELIQEFFARPGRVPSSFEDWKDFMIRPETFQPELWYLAESEGQLVGACLCFEFRDSGIGWVRQLGVLAPWRRKGLGTALLRHAFETFKRSGFPKVGLAVESDNPNAISFYEGVGMKQTRWYDECHKPIQLTGRSLA